MGTEHVETVIIGAGQAGLATAYELQRQGREALVLDANGRVGDNWRCQWDTLKLYTPAKYDGLPGMPFPGEPWHFPGKDEVGDFLESYAAKYELPVRLGVHVDRLRQAGDGFALDIGDDTLTADNVVVCTGSFGRTPAIPAFAAELDPTIQQVHSSEYRRPSQLREGPVLVVGASHSGLDIAYELGLTHQTTLCGRDTGNIPVRLESPMGRVAMPAILFMFRHVLTRRTPMGRKEMNETRFHGGPALRVKASDLRERGVDRTEARVSGVVDGRPQLDDERVLDVASVVWCTGFRQVFDWIDVPVIGEDGWPREYRGVVDDVPGLYFCGLSFQFAMSSMVLPGVERDAGYVARRLVERQRSRSSQGLAA